MSNQIKVHIIGESFSFSYNGKRYEIQNLKLADISILQGFPIPANDVIRIRKHDKNNSSVTDYYVFRHYGRQSAGYFCLAGKDYIKFKYDNSGLPGVNVTIFPKRTENICDYALRISEKQTENGPVSSFGIRSVNDPINNGKINCRQLFKFNGKSFELDCDTLQNKILYEFYEQAVSNIIDLMRSSYVVPPIADGRVLPYKIASCAPTLSEAKITKKHKFFKASYVNEFMQQNPSFLEELLADKGGRYSMITLQCHVLGQLNLQRIDCYIFDSSAVHTHAIYYQDGIQFLHFKDYRYHVRYEADPIGQKSTIKVFERSEEILKFEISYSANINNRLEGMPDSAKQRIIAAMPGIK